MSCVKLFGGLSARCCAPDQALEIIPELCSPLAHLTKSDRLITLNSDRHLVQVFVPSNVSDVGKGHSPHQAASGTMSIKS